jgi:hypothetical protein
MKNQVFFSGRFWDAHIFIAALREVKTAIENGQLVDAESRFEVMKHENILHISFNKTTSCQQF